MIDWVDKRFPQRKKLRLQGYDYSQAGMYFVTICTINRLSLLGYIVGADDPVRPLKEHISPFDKSFNPYIKLTEIGQIVSDCWHKIDSIYENVKTDAFCVMPNHVHGIIVIENKDETSDRDSKTGGQSRPPLQKVVQGFKSVTTRMCFEFDYHKIWQRSYHDRIIRTEEEYLKICKYIQENPETWLQDCYYER